MRGGMCRSLILDRLEDLADRFLELDRQLLGNRRAFLGDQRGQPARGLRDRPAGLLAPVAIVLRKRELTELASEQRRLATFLERHSPDRLERFLVCLAALGRAL